MSAYDKHGSICSAHQSQYLWASQQPAARCEFYAFLGHAVGAAQVAALREGDAQVGVGAAARTQDSQVDKEHRC